MHAFRLDGRRAYVTGGLGLIGRAICIALKEAGAETFALEPNNCQDPNVSVVAFDATDVADPMARLAALEARYGPASIWVNAAYPRTDDWGTPTMAPHGASDFARNVDLQMTATCLYAAAAAEAMAARGGGRILNIASIYGMVAPDFDLYDGAPHPTPPAYSAAKAGIIGHTRWLASHYAPKGVRANALCPGGVERNQKPEFVSRYGAKTPMGRMARPEEIGAPAAFLVSDAASYITGVALPVDGGWTSV